MKHVFSLATVALGLTLSGCSSDHLETVSPLTTQATDAASSVSATPAAPFRIYNAQPTWPLSDAQKKEMAQVNDFSLRMFHQMRTEGRSNIFSPLSLAYAMSMTGLGCNGIALQQLNEALGLPANDTTTLHDLMASLMLGLPQADDEVSINLANAFYMNSCRADVQIVPDYQQALEHTYKADCQSLDFTQEATLDYMNEWCNRQTNGFIPKVFQQLNPSHVSILMNAIYFQGDWTVPFPTEYTHDSMFTNEDGTTSTVRMMVQGAIDEYRYAEDNLMQAVCLPYAKGRYGMTLLLPREGQTTGDILNALSGERLATLDREMRYTPVSISIPRFETKQKIQLVQPMKQMGLSSWFDGGNITGMVQNPDGTPHGVFIAEATQVARIKVNEKGTEAAAVTVFEPTDGMGPEDYKCFTADHPFVYLITERSSGAVLFVGTYHGEPSADDTETGIRPIHM